MFLATENSEGRVAFVELVSGSISETHSPWWSVLWVPLALITVPVFIEIGERNMKQFFWVYGIEDYWGSYGVSLVKSSTLNRC